MPGLDYRPSGSALMTDSKVSRHRDYTRLAVVAALAVGLPACTMFGTRDDEVKPPPDVHAGADAGAASGPSGSMSSGSSTLAQAVAAQRGLKVEPSRSSGGASTGSTASSITASSGTVVQLAEGAPSAYVVKKGDTLWA